MATWNENLESFSIVMEWGDKRFWSDPMHCMQMQRNAKIHHSKTGFYSILWLHPQREVLCDVHSMMMCIGTSNHAHPLFHNSNCATLLRWQTNVLQCWNESSSQELQGWWFFSCFFLQECVIVILPAQSFLVQAKWDVTALLPMMATMILSLRTFSLCDCAILMMRTTMQKNWRFVMMHVTNLWFPWTEEKIKHQSHVSYRSIFR